MGGALVPPTGDGSGLTGGSNGVAVHAATAANAMNGTNIRAASLPDLMARTSVPFLTVVQHLSNDVNGLALRFMVRA